MENKTGRYTTTYDELSQMRTVTSPPNFRITDAWDAVGQRAVMTAPTGGRFTCRDDGNHTEDHSLTCSSEQIAKIQKGKVAKDIADWIKAVWIADNDERFAAGSGPCKTFRNEKGKAVDLAPKHHLKLPELE